MTGGRCALSVCIDRCVGPGFGWLNGSGGIRESRWRCGVRVDDVGVITRSHAWIWFRLCQLGCLYHQQPCRQEVRRLYLPCQHPQRRRRRCQSPWRRRRDSQSCHGRGRRRCRQQHVVHRRKKWVVVCVIPRHYLRPLVRKTQVHQRRTKQEGGRIVFNLSHAMFPPRYPAVPYGTQVHEVRVEYR